MAADNSVCSSGGRGAGGDTLARGGAGGTAGGFTSRSGSRSPAFGVVETSGGSADTFDGGTSPCAAPSLRVGRPSAGSRAAGDDSAWAPPSSRGAEGGSRWAPPRPRGAREEDTAAIFWKTGRALSDDGVRAEAAGLLSAVITGSGT